ncbi:toxin-antitoxin system TumE family protein [Thermococcus thioreducens]|uniref:Uncharacterized protein n=1 Tax=Thermococcus thioreducens TaxID=277988 RepID=A0A1I0QAC3_9EURY|nr:DUF6516 family protein [Thermococcus thioreducens]ASJ13379.1 hypothetical protein A3L14_11025 [Thermococcus thioreducens]SEW23519.1 hypothetical protein SAMN05216170_2313 [Thermococcus thioreducens]
MSRIPLVVAIFEDKHSKALPPRDKAFKLLLSNTTFLKNIERRLTRYEIIDRVEFKPRPPVTPDDNLEYQARITFTTGHVLYIIDRFIEHNCNNRTIYQRKFSAYLRDSHGHEIVGWDNFHDEPTFQSWPLHMHGRGHTQPIPSKEQSLPEIMQAVITKHITPLLLARHIP